MGLVLGLWWAAIVNACLSLTVLQLEAPAYVKQGESLHMDCRFDLEGKTLYSIKWFRNQSEIFSYISTPSGAGVTTFSSSTPGVDIMNSLVTPSSSSELTLSNVSLMTTGYLMCMVTGGDIPFREDYDTKHVTVAVPPISRPEIRGVPANFYPGDFLSLNCSTSNSSVPPRLGWVVNHKDVTDFGLERSYPSTYTTYLGTTLYITTLGLQFWVKKKHFRDGKLVVSCNAFIPQIYNMSSTSHVVGRFTEPHHFLETKSECTPTRLCSCLHIAEIVTLVVLVIGGSRR